MTWVSLNNDEKNVLPNNFQFLEMITEDFPKSMIKTNFVNPTAAATKPSADTVDLTIDSDEDEDTLKKSVASKVSPTKVKSNGM